jgi:hypothetical protein
MTRWRLNRPIDYGDRFCPACGRKLAATRHGVTVCCNTTCYKVAARERRRVDRAQGMNAGYR